MAMDGDDGLLDVRHVLANPADQSAELVRGRIADSIGNIHSARARPNNRLEHLVEIFGIGARGIHRREFDVFDVPAGSRDHLHGPFPRLVTRQPELMLEMNVRGGDKGMNADLRRPFQRFPCAVDIFRTRACKAADDGAFHFLRDPTDGFEISRGTIGKTCFDNVNAKTRQLLRDHELLIQVHGGPGRLFTVPKGGIKNPDYATHGNVSFRNTNSLLPCDREEGCNYETGV